MLPKELEKQQHLWQVDPYSDSLIKSNIYIELNFV